MPSEVSANLEKSRRSVRADVDDEIEGWWPGGWTHPLLPYAWIMSFVLRRFNPLSSGVLSATSTCPAWHADFTLATMFTIGPK